MKIDPSGQLLHSFIDLNNLALSRFSAEERAAHRRAHLPGRRPRLDPQRRRRLRRAAAEPVRAQGRATSTSRWPASATARASSKIIRAVHEARPAGLRRRRRADRPARRDARGSARPRPRGGASTSRSSSSARPTTAASRRSATTRRRPATRRSRRSARASLGTRARRRSARRRVSGRAPTTRSELLRSVALQNASSILLARQRAEEELRRTKEALRESQERLTAALAACAHRHVPLRLRGQHVEWDGNLGRALRRRAPRRACTCSTSSSHTLHPDDRPAVAGRVQRPAGPTATHVRHGVPRHLRRTAASTGLRCRRRSSATATGQPRFMTGACRDITAPQGRRGGAARGDADPRAAQRDRQDARVQLDLSALVQAVTDAATQLSGAQFGAFFYNIDRRRAATRSCSTRCRARRARRSSSFGQPRATALFGPTFRGEAPDPLRRRAAGPALRHDGAAPRHAAGPPAGAQLPGGAGQLALGRGDRRPVLRPSRRRRLHRARRAARRRRRGAGRRSPSTTPGSTRRRSRPPRSARRCSRASARRAPRPSG